ncbi:MAG: hypothetical protein K6T26_06880 [Alicyclobacillus sp.]|nr:hypothetical protein [Alicyclobacillus sp.]
MTFLQRAEQGSALLEWTVAVWLTAMASAIAALVTGPWLARQQLMHTALSFVWDCRLAQAEAERTAGTAEVDLAPYSPRYSVYHSALWIKTVAFDDGVQYHDGYLQMGTGRVPFNAQGDSTTGGVVRWVDQGQELDVTLYLGAGWQEVGSQG